MSRTTHLILAVLSISFLFGSSAVDASHPFTPQAATVANAVAAQPLQITPEAVQWFRDTGIPIPSAVAAQLGPIAEPDQPVWATSFCPAASCLDGLVRDLLSACRTGYRQITGQSSGTPELVLTDSSLRLEPTLAPNVVMVRPTLTGRQAFTIQIQVEPNIGQRIDSRSEIRDN